MNSVLNSSTSMSRITQIASTRYGPPSLHATWTMERTIGDLGQEIRQPSNPYANLSERALIRTQVNAIKAMKPKLDDSPDRTPKGSLELGDGFMLLRAKQRYPMPCTRPERSFIRAYLTGVQSDPNDIANAPLKITRWARIRLPTGQIARSAWKDNLKPLEKLRMAWCIKLRLNQEVHFAQVNYYFTISSLGEDEMNPQALAMVLLYSPLDLEIYQKSQQTVYSVTLLDEVLGLRVIPVKDMISVVSMQPHNYNIELGVKRWYVWEKIGLDIHILCGDEESIDAAEPNEGSMFE
ncbi:hypothetical protein JB92DRAFT_3283637 [Gautieria morchelliformis]|nr:hypothetical protein JB92DRAFT_3283637 [Gautieria morchelliformis]